MFLSHIDVPLLFLSQPLSLFFSPQPPSFLSKIKRILGWGLKKDVNKMTSKFPFISNIYSSGTYRQLKTYKTHIQTSVIWANNNLSTLVNWAKCKWWSGKRKHWLCSKGYSDNLLRNLWWLYLNKRLLLDFILEKIWETAVRLAKKEIMKWT